MEGLTGNIGFDDLGRRENYTLSIMEMTVDSDVVKVSYCLFLFWSYALQHWLYCTVSSGATLQFRI